MANLRSSDWADQHLGGGFRVAEDTGRGHPRHEPPYYLNGYEHEGYEEQLPDPRESDELDELAHDDGYLPGWRAGHAYPGAELDYLDAGSSYPDAGPSYLDVEPAYPDAGSSYPDAGPSYL